MKRSRSRYNPYKDEQVSIDRVSAGGNAIIGATMQSGIKSDFNVERLMKAWRIDKETALKTIRATTQRYERKQDPKMTRNSPTSDEATRYNRINDHLFMDRMFATSKGGKSIRGITCAQFSLLIEGLLQRIPFNRKHK